MLYSEKFDKVYFRDRHTAIYRTFMAECEGQTWVQSGKPVEKNDMLLKSRGTRWKTTLESEGKNVHEIDKKMFCNVAQLTPKHVNEWRNREKWVEKNQNR